MTRINLVNPNHLTDKHLLAEYRELPRIFTAVHKLVYTPNPRVGDGWTKLMNSSRISESYRLGSGHVIFFYNKLPYLLERYREIYYVLRTKRNFNLDRNLCDSVRVKATDLINSLRLDMLHEWEPSPEEIYLNMSRLCVRSNLDNVIEELRESL